MEISAVFLQLCFCFSSLQLRQVKWAKLSRYGEMGLSLWACYFSTRLQRRAIGPVWYQSLREALAALAGRY